MKAETTDNNLYNLHKEDYIDFTKLLNVLWSGRYIIIGITTVAIILSIIYTLNVTHIPIYKATSTIDYTNHEDIEKLLPFSDLTDILNKTKESNNIESEVNITRNNSQQLLVSSQSLIFDKVNSSVKTFIDTLQKHEDRIISSMVLKEAILQEAKDIVKEKSEAVLVSEKVAIEQEKVAIEQEKVAIEQEKVAIEQEKKAIAQEKDTLMKRIASLIKTKKEFKELITFSSKLDTFIDIESQPYNGIELISAKNDIFYKINQIDGEIFRLNMHLLQLGKYKLKFKEKRTNLDLKLTKLDLKLINIDASMAKFELRVADQDYIQADQDHTQADPDLISISSISIDDISTKINKKLFILFSFVAGIIISIFIVLFIGLLRPVNTFKK